MDVHVARFDSCPKPSKVVGFTIVHKSTKKSLYLDAFVPLDECEDATDHEVAQKAWQRVKPGATQWIAEIDKNAKSVVGMHIIDT